MPFELDIETTVNGVPIRRRVQARQHLADFLREELQFTGTHLGCEHGVCGACSVLVDGKVVRGCLMLAGQAHGKRVDTIEGLSDSGAIVDPKCFRATQRRPVRLLHAGNAAHRPRAARERGCRKPGGYPRIHVRQFLPLHRLRAHHRCDRVRVARPRARRGAPTGPLIFRTCCHLMCRNLFSVPTRKW